MKQIDERGIYSAWNLALDKINAKSEFVFILNSDDWYLKNTITKIKSLFLSNKDAGIVCGRSLDFANNFEIGISKPKPLWLFPILMPIVHPACFVRKSVYEKIGAFQDKYKVSGDYDWLYRAYYGSQKFIFTKDILVNRELGGYANSNRKMARIETLFVAYNYARFSGLSIFSFLLRHILRK